MAPKESPKEATSNRNSSSDAVADEKSEIFSTLNENGIAIINTDTLWSKYLIKKAKKVSAKIHLFGHSKYANTKITNENM